MDLVDILAGLGPDNLAEKRKALMQWRINSAMGMLAPTTGTGVEAATRMLPMTGEAWTANDAGNAIQEGQYGKAAMMGLLGLLPLGGMMSAGLRAGATVPKRMGQSGAIAWHGSPHKFDKFSLDKIGTGEGAQAYGHGLYLAEHPEVARSYQAAGGTATGKPENYAADVVAMYGGTDKALKHLKSVLPPEGQTTYSGESRQMIADVIKRIETGEYNKVGNIYKTDIPDEAVARFLDWDKPLSQQHPDVQSALGPLLPKGSVNPHGLDMGGGGKILDNRMGQADPTQVQPWVLSSGGSKFGLSQKDVDRMVADYGANTTGENAYTRLTSHLGGQDPATEALRNAGIPGIRYLDGGSRSNGAGTSNFVAFDPELIRILERNGIPTGNQPWKPGEWQGMLSGTK